ncbi:MAG: hypothetical protein ACYC8S_01170 [Minisyncoccota bacterium]
MQSVAPWGENIGGPIAAGTVSTVFWALFGVVTILAALVTLALLYHWSKYGRNFAIMGTVGIVYLIGAGTLFMFSLTALGVYLSTLP